MATVGPATRDYNVLKKMVESGVTFFRFNGAHLSDNPGPDHLSYKDAMEIAEHIRSLRRFFRQPIGIYFDLGGPKIRVKHVLSVQANALDGKPKNNILHPDKDKNLNKKEQVIIYAWNEHEDKKFEKHLHSVEPEPKNRNWDDKDFVKRLFDNGRKDKNVLMLGEEVKSFRDFDEDKPINLKDGWCQLKIVKKTDMMLVCEVSDVDSKFEFRPEQGANPYRHIFPEIITKKDQNDVEVALKMGADIISLSFVCLWTDAKELQDIIDDAKKRLRNNAAFMLTKSEEYHCYISEDHHIPIFAKIETAYAVLPDDARKYAIKKNEYVEDDPNWSPLRAIAEAFDGLMVARGDLAVEVKKYEVPDLQRQVIKMGHLLNKPVIVATEMLESMRKGDSSTRAEIMDINTAVHQEADILMLSGETANIKKEKGKPQDVVREMWRAIDQAEAERYLIDQEKNLEVLQKEREKEILSRFDSIDRLKTAMSRLAQGNQVCVSARALESKAILASVGTVEAVQEIAYYRPSQKIIAITDDTLQAIRLLQYRGVYPVVMEQKMERTLDEFSDLINELHDEIRIPHPDTFNWGRIPGSDNGKLFAFLKRFNLFANNSRIKMINVGNGEKQKKVIEEVSDGKKLIEKFILLELDESRKVIMLKYSNRKPINADDGSPITLKLMDDYGEQDVYANSIFFFPGLVLVKTVIPNGAGTRKEEPNSIHEFSLPTIPYSIPEVERKYIISCKKHAKLRDELMYDALDWHYVRQYNFYFTDADDQLYKNKIMLRIRFEELLDKKQTSKHQPKSPEYRIYFTIKGPSLITSIGEVARPEKEFEVTEELKDEIKKLKGKSPRIDFDKIPDFYKSYIEDMFRDELQSIVKSNNIKYKQIASLDNCRYTFKMANGFILELDMGKETHTCQLEVELRDDPRTIKHLDEYIHDKFLGLDLPVIDDKYIKNSLKTKYPTKVLQAYALAGRIKGPELMTSVIEPVAKVRKLLGKEHRACCGRCTAARGAAKKLNAPIRVKALGKP